MLELFKKTPYLLLLSCSNFRIFICYLSIYESPKYYSMAETEESFVDASEEMSEKIKNVVIDENRGDTPDSVDSGKHSTDEVSPENDAKIKKFAVCVLGRGLKGAIKWFSLRTGYGFITCETDNKDYFFHHTALIPYSTAIPDIREKDKVEFDLVLGQKGRLEASAISGSEGKMIHRFARRYHTYRYYPTPNNKQMVVDSEQKKLRKGIKTGSKPEGDGKPEKKRNKSLEIDSSSSPNADENEKSDEKPAVKKRVARYNNKVTRRRKHDSISNAKTEDKDVQKPDENEEVKKPDEDEKV